MIPYIFKFTSTETTCPICDKVIYETSDEDYGDGFYYCCSMKPFYHMYKANMREEIYYCNEGSIVTEFSLSLNYNISSQQYEEESKTTIIYKHKTKGQQIITLSKLPEFDPKELPAFLKAAVNNIAFL